MIGKTLFDKKIDVIVKRICRDVNTPDYYDCDCGGMYEAGTRQICQRCGKKICPECKQYHGRPTNFCWLPGKLKTRQLPWSKTFVVFDQETGETTTAVIS